MFNVNLSRVCVQFYHFVLFSGSSRPSRVFTVDLGACREMSVPGWSYDEDCHATHVTVCQGVCSGNTKLVPKNWFWYLAFVWLLNTQPKLYLQNELLSRKLAYQCAKKVTYLVNETEAMSQPQQSQQQHGANEQHHPVISAFLELTNDPYSRFIILGLSSILQTIATECSTALVWHYFGENKTPSSLLGSPLDYLPNCAPSALPMPPKHNNQELRHRIRECEQFIKERSHAVEGDYIIKSKNRN